MRNAIILAAGKGTRMKSDASKVMHTIIDRPMLGYIIDALKAVHVDISLLWLDIRHRRSRMHIQM